MVAGGSNQNKKFMKGKFVKGQQNGSFCNKTGHTMDTCFKKHGYPPHFKKGSAINQISSDECEEEELPDEEPQ